MVNLFCAYIYIYKNLVSYCGKCIHSWSIRPLLQGMSIGAGEGWLQESSDPGAMATGVTVKQPLTFVLASNSWPSKWTIEGLKNDQIVVVTKLVPKILFHKNSSTKASGAGPGDNSMLVWERFSRVVLGGKPPWTWGNRLDLFKDPIQKVTI